MNVRSFAAAAGLLALGVFAPGCAHAADSGQVPVAQVIDFAQVQQAALQLGPGAALQQSGLNGQPVLHLDGQAEAKYTDTKAIDRLSGRMTISCRFKIDSLPPKGQWAAIMTKRTGGSSKPFSIGIMDNGGIIIEGYDGGAWSLNRRTSPNAVQPGVWTDVTLTFQSGGQECVYVNGASVISASATGGGMAPNSDPLVFGFDTSGHAHMAGDIARVRFYPVALTAQQVQSEIHGGLTARLAADTDYPQALQRVSIHLVRWDDPIPWTDGYGFTRYPVARSAAGIGDVVDWPHLMLDRSPVFTASGVDKADLPLRDTPQNKPLFQQPYDQVIQPGNHWLRALKWRGGQQYVYTADHTARSWSGVYELWTFPVRITPQTPGGSVQSVHLTYGGQAIYDLAGPVKSLTLLLPANETGDAYALSVGGGATVDFRVGLKPVDLGDPVDAALPVEQTVQGTSGSYALTNRDVPLPAHPEAKMGDEDDEDAQSPDGAAQAPSAPIPAQGLAHHLGVEVPVSPICVNAVGLTAGMSSGFFLNGSEHGVAVNFPSRASAFADYLADTGYDADFEMTEVGDYDRPGQDRSPDAWAAALSARGVWAGIVPDCTFLRTFVSNPSVAFYSYTLPDGHRPLYRDLQLETQRLMRYGNFRGISIGADNAGYVSYWDWAPPIPNRPWAEAYLNFQGGQPAPAPVGGANRPAKDYEVKGTTKEFVDYLHRYDATYGQYGYFAKALTSIEPSLTATTGSFGSSPGVFGRGGWPAASIPGEPIYAGMPVQQAYDWNEQTSTLPMHLEAEIDRLRSDDPKKPTWAIVDDFRLHLNKLTRERAYALALTRGLQGIGTNFLPNPTGQFARQQTIAEQKSLYAWVHRYGGVYAATESEATIGILFVQDQALMRPQIQSENAPEAELLRGSHEGKVTEALFLCHQAGFSARVVTPEELRRGLPKTMKALLLTGLNVFDDTWHWYDGLTPDLQSYQQGGGKILCDDESVCPASVPSTQTGMAVAAYVVNRDKDWTSELFARNRGNSEKLRQAMTGPDDQLVRSGSESVWCIPAHCGNTLYATVVDMATSNPPELTNADQSIAVVDPATANLTWRPADRPIYNVRLGRRLTPAEAQQCDLTKDSFQWYALPIRPITEAPTCQVTADRSGGYDAAIRLESDGAELTGVPVSLTVAQGGETATVYGASGHAVKLPLKDSDPSGSYTLTAKELLSGKSGTTQIDVASKPAEPSAAIADAVRRFFARKEVPLVIALTSAQMRQPGIAAMARQVAALAEANGRRASIKEIATGSVVLGAQPLKITMRYPHLRTIDADFILLGSPRDNMLIQDEARGLILPAKATQGDASSVSVIYSPFAGERDALNLIGGTEGQVSQSVKTMMSLLGGA